MDRSDGAHAKAERAARLAQAREALAALSGWADEAGRRLQEMADDDGLGDARGAARALIAELETLQSAIQQQSPSLERLPAGAEARAGGTTAPAPGPPTPAAVGRALASVLTFLAWGDESISYDEHSLMQRIVQATFDADEAARDAALQALSVPRTNGDLPLNSIATLRQGLSAPRRSALCEQARIMLATNGGIKEIEEVRLQAVEAVLCGLPSAP